jgi:undecaprenyl diphosphate synthase
VEVLTLYTFSTENWRRPREEVDGLMRLLHFFLATEVEDLHANGVRLRIIGDVEALPSTVKTALTSACRATETNRRLQLFLALNYSGRRELAQAFAKLVQAAPHPLPEGEALEQAIAGHLYAPDVPDPDLLIRTSGELRLSNFMLWQLAYTEIYVTPVLWPDFRREHLREALHAYAARERRFGAISSVG